MPKTWLVAATIFVVAQIPYATPQVDPDRADAESGGLSATSGVRLLGHGILLSNDSDVSEDATVMSWLVLK